MRMKKPDRVDPRRVRILREGPHTARPVVYWMSRDQRVADNWALLYAQELAAQNQAALGILFCLAPSVLGSALRQYNFMIDGLRRIEKDLAVFRIPLFLVTGNPEREIPRFVRNHNIGTLVADFSPLRIHRKWREAVSGNIDISFYEVDSHNIVPCWVASQKQEYAAYTFRPKLNKLLPEFLTGFPSVKRQRLPWPGEIPVPDWDSARKTLKIDTTVREISWATPGEAAAQKIFKKFMEGSFADYYDARNDPTKPGQSGVSPYLHFGQISAQGMALEIARRDDFIKSQEAFIEQLIVRRELADNFCCYNRNYDNADAFPQWARQTLAEHRRDIRPYRYGREQLERGLTHDDLWNAAQQEMAVTGKMHGYLRMYWAKKILEWAASPDEALDIAVYLNDKYELDGRDPNGYAGIAWSIGGVHDRPWFEREIYGKIRYMSYDGCRRKFDVPAYIAAVSRTIAEAEQ
jgi:deoxyribodipyrimidine photo-lyase